MTRRDATQSSPRGMIGSLALLAGLVLLTLRGIETAHALSGFPRFWHNHDALWWGAGLATAAFGVWVVGQAAFVKDQLAWKPARPGCRFRKLLLYSRPGCSLCDDARHLLERHGRWLPPIVEVNIDHDPRLAERFGNCVPVISCDGKVRFRGRVSELLLRRLIEGTPPADS